MGRGPEGIVNVGSERVVGERLITERDANREVTSREAIVESRIRPNVIRRRAKRVEVVRETEIAHAAPRAICSRTEAWSIFQTFPPRGRRSRASTSTRGRPPSRPPTSSRRSPRWPRGTADRAAGGAHCGSAGGCAGRRASTDRCGPTRRGSRGTVAPPPVVEERPEPAPAPAPEPIRVAPPAEPAPAPVERRPERMTPPPASRREAAPERVSAPPAARAATPPAPEAPPRRVVRTTTTVSRSAPMLDDGMRRVQVVGKIDLKKAEPPPPPAAPRARPRSRRRGSHGAARSASGRGRRGSQASPQGQEGHPQARARSIRSAEIAAVAVGRKPLKKRAAPGKEQKRTEITTPSARKRIVRITEAITVGDLARADGPQGGGGHQEAHGHGRDGDRQSRSRRRSRDPGRGRVRVHGRERRLRCRASEIEGSEQEETRGEPLTARSRGHGHGTRRPRQDVAARRDPLDATSPRARRAVSPSTSAPTR